MKLKKEWETRQVAVSQTYDLRGRVLRPGMPPEASHFPKDQESVHFGLLENGKVLAVVTAHPENHPSFSVEGQWRIRGMATEPERQGEGLGRALLDALLEWARRKGIRLLWCNARERAIPFYERAGFTVESEIFSIPGVGPHKVMRILL